MLFGPHLPMVILKVFPVCKEALGVKLKFQVDWAPTISEFDVTVHADICAAVITKETKPPALVIFYPLSEKYTGNVIVPT